MSDYDILADKVSECVYEGMSPREMTDALIAAGVRPPARVITTHAELETLPLRSVVIDGCEDEILCRTEQGWAEFGSDIHCTSYGVWLPVTVLHVPAEAKS